MLAAGGDDVGPGKVPWLGCPGVSEFEATVGGDADWLADWFGWGADALDASFGEVRPLDWFGAVAGVEGGAAGSAGAVGVLLWGAGDPIVGLP
jgi:hypothetical protein